MFSYFLLASEGRIAGEGGISGVFESNGGAGFCSNFGPRALSTSSLNCLAQSVASSGVSNSK